MTVDHPGQLHRLDIPRDASGLLSFDPTVMKEIRNIIAAARADGRWVRPVDTSIDLADPRFWAYWIWKSMNPVEAAMAGSNLEEHFRRETGSLFEFKPGTESDGIEITLSLVGDLMGTPGLIASRGSLYKFVEDLIFGADLAYGNLESTLTTKPLVPLSFRLDDAPAVNISPAEYEVLTCHKGRRFDVLQLANNHILDHGLDGVATTLDRLEQDGVAQVGVNPPEKGSACPQVTEMAGTKIGWVAHTFSVNFKPFPNEYPGIINMTPFHLEESPDLSTILGQIAECRALDCELVIVSLHWGLEFELYPHPKQLAWARAFADAGADLVVGHHPHVVQPIEIYTPPNDPGRQVPIIYSLGNLTPVFSNPSNACSLVARATIGGGSSRQRVRRLELVPVSLLESGSDNGKILELWPLARLVDEGDKLTDDVDYVREMARYADIALGSKWRENA